MHKITYETEMSSEEAFDITNESLRLIDCSPLKKHVRTLRAFNHGNRKIEGLFQPNSSNSFQVKNFKILEVFII